MDLLAKDIMTETVVACVPDAKVEDIVKTLADNEISGMPVIDEQQRVVGIISESDLLLSDRREPPRVKTALYGWYILRQSVMDREAELRGLRAEDVMTRDVIVFGPVARVDEIAEKMVERRINRVPIVEGGRLVGVISRGDIIRAMAQRK